MIGAVQHRESEGSEKGFDEYVSKAGYSVERLFRLFAPEKGVMTYYEEHKHGIMKRTAI
ncbi:MAG: hypothetical protein J5697_01290 [Clostridia bacterium]|nr:hypothetical protein [Clostridia bacterium]